MDEGPMVFLFVYTILLFIFGGVITAGVMSHSLHTDDDCHIKNVDCIEKCEVKYDWYWTGKHEACWFERVNGK